MGWERLGRGDFTVEFRRKLGFSNGIPGDTVLISRTRGERTVVLRNVNLPGKPPLTEVRGKNLRILVKRVSGDQATIRLTHL